MPVEKSISKIRAQIDALRPYLDTFSDPAQRPGAEDCLALQRLLWELGDHLSVYKFARQNSEVSPNFSLHAHISEAAETIKSEAVPEPAPAPETPAAAETKLKKVEPEEPAPPIRAMKPLQIGLNDKFRFINELFAHNDAEYHIAVEQLGGLQTWAETDLYLNSLRNLYGWQDNQEAVKYFYSLVRKRFQ